MDVVFMLMLFVTVAAYSCLIFWFYLAWKKLRMHSPAHSGMPGVSVVVAARNEEQHIEQLLLALKDQQYPGDLYEVILVDDRSDDRTWEIAYDFIEKHALSGFRLLKTEPGPMQGGKKQALDLGISHARYPYIATTDADCIPSATWLNGMASEVAKNRACMVLGPVMMEGAEGWLHSLQKLEFLSLMGATAGAAAMGRAIMCNGASLLFSREMFLKTSGYQDKLHFLSGDDVFLLHKFKTICPDRIVFLKSHSALVATQTKEGLKDFFYQRMRWASKTPGYQDRFALLVAMAVAFSNTALLAAWIAMPFGILNWKVVLAATIMKALPDYLMLSYTTRFFDRQYLMRFFFLLFAVYPFYVLISALGGLFRKNRW